MKKVFFVLAACAVVSAALVGCGSSSSPESQSVATSDNAVAQNKGDIGPYHFEISDTARTEEITEGTALIVKYTITNNSDETITPGSVNLFSQVLLLKWKRHLRLTIQQCQFKCLLR